MKAVSTNCAPFASMQTTLDPSVSGSFLASCRIFNQLRSLRTSVKAQSKIHVDLATGYPGSNILACMIGFKICRPRRCEAVLWYATHWSHGELRTFRTLNDSAHDRITAKDPAENLFRNKGAAILLSILTNSASFALKC